MRTRTLICLILVAVCFAATVPAQAAWDDRQLKIGDPQAFLWLRPVDSHDRSVYLRQPDGSRKMVTADKTLFGMDVLARGFCFSQDRRPNEAEYRVDNVARKVIPIPATAWQKDGNLDPKLLDFVIDTRGMGIGPHSVEVLFKVNGKKWGSDGMFFEIIDDSYEDALKAGLIFEMKALPDKVTTERSIRQLPGPPADLPELQTKPSDPAESADPMTWPLTSARTIRVPTRAMTRGQSYVAVLHGKTLGVMAVVDASNGMASLQAVSGTIPDPEIQKFDLHLYTGKGGQA